MEWRCRGSAPGLQSHPSVDAQATVALKPEVLKTALSEARGRLKSQDSPMRGEVDTISSRIAELDALFEEWADRLDRQLIDEAQFRSHNKVLMAERDKLLRRLKELQTKLGEGERLEISLSEVEQMLKDAAQAWDNLQFEEKREFIRLLIEKVAVHPDGVELHLFHLPPERLEARRSGRLYRQAKAITQD